MNVRCSFKIWIVLFSILWPWASSNGAAPSMRIDDKTLILIPTSKCKKNPKENAESLSKYLDQYNFAVEWGLTHYHRDEGEDDQNWKPFTSDDQKLLSDGLVEAGFSFPNGHIAPITWMDFDGDGLCDFAAPVGGNGMYPTQRTFLYRGKPDGRYQLVLADYLYFEDSVAIVPFIPLGVSGEKLPAILLATGDGWNLFQWSPTEQALKACRLPKYDSFERPAHVLLPLSKQTLPADKFKQVCERIDDVGKWAESQLPRNNVAPRYCEEYVDSTCKAQAASDATHANQKDSTFQTHYQECRLRYQ